MERQLIETSGLGFVPVFTLEKKVRKNRLDGLLKTLILKSSEFQAAVIDLKRTGFRKDYALTLLRVSAALPRGLHILINDSDLDLILKDTCISGFRVKMYFSLEDFIEGIPAIQRKIEHVRLHPHVQQTLEQVEGPKVEQATNDEEVGRLLQSLTDSPHLPEVFHLSVVRQHGDYRIAIPQAILLKNEGPPSDHDEEFAESFRGCSKSEAYNEFIRRLEVEEEIHVHGYDSKSGGAYSLLMKKENGNLTYKSVRTITV